MVTDALARLSHSTGAGYWGAVKRPFKILLVTLSSAVLSLSLSLSLSFPPSDKLVLVVPI